MVMMVFTVMLGCHQSPSQRYKLASDTFSDVVDTVTLMSQTDRISLEDLRRFNDVAIVGEALLDEVETAIIEEREFNQWQALDRVLDELIRLQLLLERKQRDGTRSSRSPDDHKDPIGFGGSGDGGKPRLDAGGDGRGRPPTQNEHGWTAGRTRAA